MTDHQPTLRVAEPDDKPAIDVLMQQSAAALFPRFYDARQTESAVRYVARADPLLLADGTFFTLEADGEIVGCGGWSRRHRLHADVLRLQQLAGR